MLLSHYSLARLGHLCGKMYSNIMTYEHTYALKNNKICGKNWNVQKYAIYRIICK